MGLDSLSGDGKKEEWSEQRGKMRERAERCRPCSDEKVFGKEWLNLSALGDMSPNLGGRLQLLLLLLCSLLLGSCLLKALPDPTLGRAASGREGCLPEACLR